MKRAIKHVVVFALLACGGVVMSYVVAWGCAYWVAAEMTPRITPEQGYPLTAAWNTMRADGILKGKSDFSMHKTSDRRADPLDWSLILKPFTLSWDPTKSDAQLIYVYGVNFYGRGWPFISHVAIHTSEREMLWNVPSRKRIGSERSIWEGWELPDGMKSLRPTRSSGWRLDHMPLRPVWPGLLLNTAFYGSILWLLWLTPGMIRRGSRRRRGLCVRCGYDLRGGGSKACPECGADSTAKRGKPAR